MLILIIKIKLRNNLLTGFRILFFPLLILIFRISWLRSIDLLVYFSIFIGFYFIFFCSFFKHFYFIMDLVLESKDIVLIMCFISNMNTLNISNLLTLYTPGCNFYIKLCIQNILSSLHIVVNCTKRCNFPLKLYYISIYTICNSNLCKLITGSYCKACFIFNKNINIFLYKKNI